MGDMAEDAEPHRTPEETAILAELLEQEAPWTAEERGAIIAFLRRESPDSHLIPVQRGNLASMWECWADVARDRDALRLETGGWEPPNLAALVAAVRQTRLTRFFPFMGHDILYFADGPGIWDDKGEVAPACIANRPEGYVVSQGAVGYGPPGPAIDTLTTYDPDEAAAEAERLLEGWAWSGQES
jgi:hypothetical protein